ncbi:MAG: LysE family transporter [Anaerolineaceae bacterium]|nr:LysE family transporter [Anaerolineaceae bacterium]
MANFYPFLIYVFVTTFTPGPNNIMSMTNAMHYGYKRTLQFTFGVVSGFFIVMICGGILNMALAATLPAVKIWLNVLGAIYMLYLAYHILISKPVPDDLQPNKNASFKAGFIMQFLNIKGILYGITVFSMFIIDSFHSPLMVLVFSLILSGVGFTAVTSWAYFGNLFRRFLLQHYKVFNLVMAGLLVYTALASFFEK